MSDVRVRFAPSPTGYLHVGGLRTALFNYLFAAGQGGKTILRIEDTDQSRKVEGAVENLIKSLQETGVVFDEGAHLGGEFGPYVQSERLALYQKYLDQLLTQEDAYHCFCSEEVLAQMREEQLQKKESTKYDGRCRHLSSEVVQAKLAEKAPFVVRLKIREDRGDYIIEDEIRGKVHFSPEQIDDQILLKSDGFPTYHLANVVDDHLMQITHVIRGEEWLPSTPKHVQLYEYLGWKAPKFAHLPLLLNSDRSKLSKRQGDVATEDFLKKGILPECLINFIALLGWNTQDDQEIFSMEELISNFSLDRVGKAGAVFDQDKLLWMNQQYIKNESPEDLFEKLRPFLPDFSKSTDEELLKKMVLVIRDRLSLLSDVEEQLGFFYHDSPEITDEGLLSLIKSESAQLVYQAFLEEMETQENLSSENFGKVMKLVQKKTKIKGKNLWIPMRIAITLIEQGPDLMAVVDIFGKEKCLDRIKMILD
ncbi:MAG: glutamate--tRNA ligase [SAR324 cluster bacterium]|uniref:Glutamate--tRNA ligase n=1 Tax=SAR324 cluster bacterium TaxID=2024889 RepID=A0A2A4T8X0_9DELT|nr:MAG: glutamate--tRNA ligase [SAR324 cluster bacterium]